MSNAVNTTNQALLSDMLSFIHDEQAYGIQKLVDVWEHPLAGKLEKGWSQSFLKLERGSEPQTLWAYPDDSESRFREGDLLFLHSGKPLESPLCRRLTLESEEEDRWVLRGKLALTALDEYDGGKCYADPDAMDLTPFYEQSIADIATSQIGRDVILPLLSGSLEIGFDDRDYTHARQIALAENCNEKQAEAVALAFAAEQVVCIQGPPGTGKTRVLSLIAKLMVERGERILMTSHTHMAINNALNKIHSQGVPTVKVGANTQRKGLVEQILCFPGLDDWSERPTNGYVVGATPFATCTARLENYEFDSIIFDEASQITVPLALMAMRKGKRFIFIGDQKQLPPVLVSRSILSKDAYSVFSKLTSLETDHSVMLDETYRMNRWLTAWPSQNFYNGKLLSAGKNKDRQLTLVDIPPRFTEVFNPAASSVFIPTLDRAARTRNYRDAELVADLCEAAVSGGMPLHEIGIVSPYRAHGRLVRNLLTQRFGRVNARQVVADTVERMQGQERELIILSLATGDETFLSMIAEFFFQPERLNVSITRAMTKLIVIGPDIKNVPELEKDTVQQWVAQYQDMVRQCKRVEL